MTKLLAIDSSTEACSVALLTSNNTIVQDYVLSPREHTQRLLPMVDQLLANANIRLQELDGIAYSRGPGSFTGLRISLSIAQGLAYAADIPLIPVSTLDAMAVGFLRKTTINEPAILIPAIDARMDEVYWRTYNVTSGTTQSVVDRLEPIDDEQVSAPDTVKVNSVDKVSLFAMGSGWYHDRLQRLQPATCTVEFYPEACDVALIAANTCASKTSSIVTGSISALEAQPVYIRDEVSWKKRARIRQ